MRKAWNALRGGPSDGHPSRDSFWGLRDVSFDVYQGEVVGVIGSNGAAAVHTAAHRGRICSAGKIVSTRNDSGGLSELDAATVARGGNERGKTAGT